jgi:hypothetical protein
MEMDNIDKVQSFLRSLNPSQLATMQRLVVDGALLADTDTTLIQIEEVMAAGRNPGKQQFREIVGAVTLD